MCRGRRRASWAVCYNTRRFGFDDADDWPFRELGAMRGVRGGVSGVCAGDADADWGEDRMDCRSCNLLCEVLAVRDIRGKSV